MVERGGELRLPQKPLAEGRVFPELGRGDVIVTRAPGYLVQVGHDELDLYRFERLVATARGADPETAAATLRQALGLWRGPTLADLAHASFAQTPILRLEELRLAALELRIDAELTLGRHAEILPELTDLAREHRLGEGLRAQLMVALYRCGRQAEALAASQEARRTLDEELGLEPGRALRDAQQAILRQEPALEVAPAHRERRSVLVAARESAIEPLLALAEPLATRSGSDVVLVAVAPAELLSEASERLAGHRERLRARGVDARVAAFTSLDPGSDVPRIVSEHDVSLALVDDELPSVEAVLTRAPCDVALVSAPAGDLVLDASRPVLVPFGGSDHDWAAVELGTWLAQAHTAPLALVGTTDAGGRDASRLLATAALIVQRVAGIDTTTAVVEPNEDALVRVAGHAGLVVFGVSGAWPKAGLGSMRQAVVRGSAASTLLVRKGVRPGGLAPAESQTRFTWTLQG